MRDYGFCKVKGFCRFVKKWLNFNFISIIPIVYAARCVNNIPAMLIQRANNVMNKRNVEQEGVFSSLGENQEKAVASFLFLLSAEKPIETQLRS